MMKKTRQIRVRHKKTKLISREKNKKGIILDSVSKAGGLKVKSNTIDIMSLDI